MDDNWRRFDYFNTTEKLLGRRSLDTELVYKGAKVDEQDIWKFLQLLHNLSGGIRSTTQRHDYIISVWADCPKYKILENYKKLPVGRLMEDALQQLQQNHGFRLGHNVPATLIEGDSDPEELVPKNYYCLLPNDPIKQLYGPFPPNSPVCFHVSDGKLVRGHVSNYAQSFGLVFSNLRAIVGSSRHAQLSSYKKRSSHLHLTMKVES